MPKQSTYPTIYDSVKQISISDLKKLGYLKQDTICEGVLTWSMNGETSGSISIKSNTVLYPWQIRLSYNYMDKPIVYHIKIVSIPSNLGKGFINYFVCPKTKKRARKLYLVNGFFLHREAFKNCMYDTQTNSKKFREYKKIFGNNNLYEEIYKKHFKKTYAGKPTKRYLRIMEQIKKAEKKEAEVLKKSSIYL